MGESIDASLVVDLLIPAAPVGDTMPEFVRGFEHNAKQQLGPRYVNLGASMDPKKCAL